MTVFYFKVIQRYWCYCAINKLFKNADALPQWCLSNFH
uniref:Uncharacterized protein n=1 Tax=Ciona intestinalis TaxID=7719 RepID=H2XTS8_CIOIN